MMVTVWIRNLLLVLACCLYHCGTASGWLVRDKSRPTVHTMDCVTATAAFGKRIPLCGTQGAEKRSGTPRTELRSRIHEALSAQLRNRFNLPDSIMDNVNDDIAPMHNINKDALDDYFQQPEGNLDDILELLQEKDRDEKYRELAASYKRIATKKSEATSLNNILTDTRALLWVLGQSVGKPERRRLRRSN